MLANDLITCMDQLIQNGFKDNCGHLVRKSI